VLRSTRWWPADPAPGTAGIRWLRPDGTPMQPPDWEGGTTLAILFGSLEAGTAKETPTSTTPPATPKAAPAWLLLVNAGARGSK
ncbi:hypothetical protein ACEN8K_46995, partial [Variovorax sp. CT11-76]